MSIALTVLDARIVRALQDLVYTKDMPNQIDWNQPYSNNRDFKWVSTSETEKLAALAGDASSGSLSLLDVGCGTGQLVRDMYHRGFEVSGIDISTKAIDIAKISSVYVGDGLDFKVGDALEPYNHVYNLIVCKYVIAFLPKRHKFYENALSAMYTTSKLIIITPQEDLLPTNKKSIGINHKVLYSELKNYFKNVSKIKSNEDWWYICQM